MEHHARVSDDPRTRAGSAAEATLAHYLRRAYGDAAGVWVFHGLRLERSGEVAQVDHLLLHRYGAVVVESKSVTGRVQVNARGEWARLWDGEWRGMPSPVLQAERQAALLHALLEDHHVRLLDRAIFGLVQGRFGAFPFDVLVAISDGGIIESESDQPQVCKADQVSARARERIEEHRRLANPLSREERARHTGRKLSEVELARTRDFLLEQHRPRVEPFRCRSCQGTALEVRYRHSYHFHCRTCQTNTPIRLTCPACGERARTRKQGGEYYRECAACALSERFF